MTRLHQILNKYIHKTHLFDILDFFRDNKINNLYFTKTITLPLNFSSNNLIGGEIYDFNVKIDYQVYKVQIDEYVDNIGKLLSFLIKKIIYIVIYCTTIRIIIFWYSITFDILSELVNNIKNTNLDNMNLDYLYKSFHLNFDEQDIIL
jgi:hypothetical protein